MGEFEVVPQEEIIRSQLRQMVDVHGIAAIQNGLDTVKKDLRTELAQTRIYQKMAGYAGPDSWIDKEGSTLFVSMDRAFRDTILNDLWDFKETIERDPTFSNVVRTQNIIRAKLVEPEAGIEEVEIRIDKARV
jgi:hypothetical protein